MLTPGAASASEPFCDSADCLPAKRQARCAGTHTALYACGTALKSATYHRRICPASYRRPAASKKYFSPDPPLLTGGPEETAALAHSRPAFYDAFRRVFFPE